jgi:hypothetical protein
MLDSKKSSKISLWTAKALPATADEQVEGEKKDELHVQCKAP